MLGDLVEQAEAIFSFDIDDGARLGKFVIEDGSTSRFVRLQRFVGLRRGFCFRDDAGQIDVRPRTALCSSSYSNLSRPSLFGSKPVRASFTQNESRIMPSLAGENFCAENI